jgi:4-hydroxybenzoate polyprenyltransferase
MQTTRIRGYLAATHFPQALAMVVLMTGATWIFGGSPAAVIAVLCASAAGQATVGWTNDLHDAGVDAQASRTHKPTVRGDIRPSDLRIPIIVSGSLTIPLSFLAAGWVGGAAHITAVASALMYNFFLARTVWSWLPYAVSFGLIPVFVAQAASTSLWPSAPVIALSILVGVTAHLLNAIPDIDVDRASGWGGLAVSLGKRWSIVVATVLGAVATACLVAVLVDVVGG